VRPNLELIDTDAYPTVAAARISRLLPEAPGSVVVTGGTTAAKIYEHLDPFRWDGIDVFFSDERCVPPDHAESNFKMATDLFLGVSGAKVHRMEGELEPLEAARRYHDEIQPFVAEGMGLLLLGMGADCHVGALYPYSDALESADHCAAVERPDGLGGLTLTPQAMLSARSIRVLVTGEKKSEALVRVMRGDEEVTKCPARLLLSHPDVTFWIDEGAASLL
jgi:6-phosphogluconolactonase